MKKIVDFDKNNTVEILEVTAIAIQITAEYNEEIKDLALYPDESGTITFLDSKGNKQVLYITFESNTLTMSRTAEIEVVELMVLPISKYFDVNTVPHIEVSIVDSQISLLAINSKGTEVDDVEINTVVNRINAEAQRRRGTGAISARASTVSQGAYITKANYDNIAAPIREARSVTLPTQKQTKLMASGVGSYTLLNNECATLESYTSLTGSSTGCSSSCTGLCSSSCYSSCSGSCSGGCSGSCSGSCSGACGSSCSGGCDGDCWNQCTNSSAEWSSFTPGCGDCC